LTIEPRRRPVGAGFVNRLLPFRKRRMVGPFIFVDHIGPETLAPGQGTDVDAHPHIGLSTLTYLFEGRMVHRDSVGSHQVIEPGDVNWMTAGSGVTHTERSVDDDRPVAAPIHGLQIWVALPGHAENGPASFDHQPAAALPIEVGRIGTGSNYEIEVIAGSGFDMTSPVPVSSPLVLARIQLEGPETFSLPAEHPERAVLALSDGVTINDRPLANGSMAIIAEGEKPRLRGADGGRADVMVFAGEPVGPRHIWWNFVHSDPDVIEQAKRRWVEQAFPTVAADHEVWVPLPQS
jgi:redox-sensitive bicupin YhaK (pirin superfamily)